MGLLRPSVLPIMLLKPGTCQRYLPVCCKVRGPAAVVIVVVAAAACSSHRTALCACLLLVLQWGPTTAADRRLREPPRIRSLFPPCQKALASPTPLNPLFQQMQSITKHRCVCLLLPLWREHRDAPETGIGQLPRAQVTGQLPLGPQHALLSLYTRPRQYTRLGPS
jgi:hypothetical protein